MNLVNMEVREECRLAGVELRRAAGGLIRKVSQADLVHLVRQHDLVVRFLEGVTPATLVREQRARGICVELYGLAQIWLTRQVKAGSWPHLQLPIECPTRRAA